MNKYTSHCHRNGPEQFTFGEIEFLRLKSSKSTVRNKFGNLKIKEEKKARKKKTVTTLNIMLQNVKITDSKLELISIIFPIYSRAIIYSSSIFVAIEKNYVINCAVK